MCTAFGRKHVPNKTKSVAMEEVMGVASGVMKEMSKLTHQWTVEKELTYLQDRNGNAHTSHAEYISRKNMVAAADMRICR